MSKVMTLKQDRLYTLSVPSNIVPHEALIEASDLVSVMDIIGAGSYVDEESEWHTWLVEEGDNQGTWPKRFSKQFRKTTGKKIDPTVNSRLGEIVRRHAKVEEKKYYFAISPYADWSPGSFQESAESCWWGGYNGARLGLMESGGQAVLWYRDRKHFLERHREEGIGRCWLWDMPSYSLVFNAYSSDPELILSTMARVIARVSGLSYTKVITKDDDNVFINADTAYAIGTKNILSIVKEQEPVVMSFGLETEGFMCWACEETYPEDEMYWAFDERYCYDCFSYRFCTCERCSEAEYNDDVIEVKHGRWWEYWCKDCVDNNAYCCQDCDRYYSEPTIEVEGYKEVCVDCIYKYTSCEECGTYTDEVEEKNGMYYCHSCYEELEKQDED